MALPPCEQYAKGDMVNIRGRNAQEFYANLTAYDAHMAEMCAEVVANIRAKWNVIGSLGGETVSVARDNAQAPPQNGYQQPSGGQGYQQPQQPQGGAQGFQGGQAQGGYQQSQGGYQQQPAPQQPSGNGIPTQPPPHVGPPPSCSHGVKNFIAKGYKGGKPGYWMAWACPAQQGDPSQHQLEFIDQKR